MRRLTHSFKAYLRYMQMSRHQVFAFVEGKVNDPYFYGKICDSVCHPSGVSYEICRAQELSVDSGGKQVLISFFKYLRQKSTLFSIFKEKSTGVLFFLDKDVDDFLRTKKRSNHVVYTHYYDIENHIFYHVDLIEQIAVSASLDCQEVKSYFPDITNLKRNLAVKWKKWVKLCLFVTKKKINCEFNYGVPSRINNPLHGPVDQTEYNRRLDSIKETLGITSTQFHNSFKRISDYVDEIYDQGEHDRIFKGKWYAQIIASMIKDRVGKSIIHSVSLETRLISNATMSLDFEKSWADHFKEPVKNLINIL